MALKWYVDLESTTHIHSSTDLRFGISIQRKRVIIKKNEKICNKNMKRRWYQHLDFLEYSFSPLSMLFIGKTFFFIKLENSK